MIRLLQKIFLLAAVFGGTAAASLISNINVQVGTWDGFAFTQTHGIWQTGPSNWAVGITDPALGDSLLYTSAQADLGLPFGGYYLYMQNDGLDDQALQIELTYEGGAVQTAVYTSSGGVVNGPGDYTLVSGGGLTAELVLNPQSTYVLVNSGQVYTPGTSNWIIGLNVPEPGSWQLLLAGSAVLLGLRRVRSQRRRLS